MSRSSNGPAPTVADTLRPYLIEQCETALTLGEQVRHQLGQASEGPVLDPDQVHDLRVALRRIRSVLRVFDDVFSVPEAGRLSDDAGWFTQHLGAVRDLDVVSARIEDAINELPDDLVIGDPVAVLRKAVASRRAVAEAEVRDAIHSETYVDLTDQLRRWHTDPVWSATAERPAGKIKKYVKRADHRLGKRLQRAANAITGDDPDTDDRIHAVRKSGKRHRYAVEAAREVLGASADKITESRKTLQDWLGDYQDSVQTATVLQDLARSPSGFTFGVLHAREAAHRAKVRKRLARRAD